MYLQVQALRMDGVKAAAMSSDQDYQVLYFKNDSNVLLLASALVYMVNT
jgi:hypothetical protein